MLILKISRHSPENCPIINEAPKKLAQQIMSQLPGIAAKYGVKVVGGWAVPNEHLLVMVYETPTIEAFQKLLMEPIVMKWIATQDKTEFKLAMTLEESMKLCK